MDLKLIKKVINMTEEANISGLIVEYEGLKIEVKKENPQSGVIAKTDKIISLTNEDLSASQSMKESDIIQKKEQNTDLIAIKSPMVGTFYASSSPDAENYVKEGSKIEEGQTVCIIEAMKIFNEIESDVSGIVEKILVKNSTPVEYGQELFLVRPN